MQVAAARPIPLHDRGTHIDDEARDHDHCRHHDDDDRRTGLESVIDIGGTQLLGMTVTSDAIWAISFDAGTIARVDPTTNTVTASYDVPGAASALAVNGVVWVASYDGPRSLVAIDSTDGALRASVEAGELCCDLTTDGTDVWAIDPAGRLLQIGDGGVDRADPVDVDSAQRPHQRRVRGREPVGIERSTPLHRIDPATGATTDVDVGGGVPFLEHAGLVWGASPTEIWAVDPATGQVAERSALDGSTEVLSLNFDAEDDVWVGIVGPDESAPCCSSTEPPAP